MSAATQETEQRGGENVSVDVNKAVKVAVAQKGRISENGSDVCRDGNHMTNLQGALPYTSLVKYGLGEAAG